MPKQLATAVAALALGIGAASAADLGVEPLYKAPVVPIFSWTGCYGGLHAGGGEMNDAFTSEHGIGAIAGGQLGCNYQTGMLVVGVEGEGWWSGLRDTFTVVQPTPFISTNGTAKDKWDYDVAARLGLAIDRALVYGKAGYAGGRFDFSEFTSFSLPPPGSSRSVTSSATLDGLLVGLGLEYAVSGPWTVKFEYDHVGFGTKNKSFNVCDTPGTCITDIESVSASKDIFKVGANFYFFK